MTTNKKTKQFENIREGNSKPEFRHIPVLLNEINEHLDIRSDDIVLDGTLGAGGHAKSMIEKLGSKGIFIGIDQDPDELAITTKELQASYPEKNIHTYCNNFRNLDQVLDTAGIMSFTKGLFDLGLSSMQLENPDYGMTFRFDAPLSMVMKRDTTDSIITAFDVVNDWEEETLANIIFAFGDERYSRRIAKGIVEARGIAPIRTTMELSEIIRKSVPAVYARGKIHPATRTFQAIRIIVNDEFEAIKEGLAKAIDRLASSGMIAVITFHSGEDRIVKQLFKHYIDQGGIEKINKKPIVPSFEETKQNPRARSAKLRIIQKIKL